MTAVRVEVVSSRGSTATCRLAGDLDASNADHFGKQLAALLAQGYSHLILDARHLSFVDSSGLQALVEADEACRAAGGGIEVQHPTDAVQRVLRIADLGAQFGVAD